MKNYCIFRFSKIKTYDKLNEIYQHDMRISKANNADPERKYHNNILAGDPDITLKEALINRISELSAYSAGKQPRKNAVLAYDILLSRSRSAPGDSFPSLTWEAENIKWLKDTFGEDNVIFAISHHDEGPTSHIHACVVPEYEGKLNASHYTGRKELCRGLQDSYAEAMAQFGLRRGESGFVKDHIPMRTFHKAVQREFSYEAPEARENETAAEYRQRVQEEIRQIKLKHLEELIQKERASSEAIQKAQAAERESNDLAKEYQSYKEDYIQSKELAAHMRGILAGVDKLLADDDRREFQQLLRVLEARGRIELERDALFKKAIDEIPLSDYHSTQEIDISRQSK